MLRKGLMVLLLAAPATAAAFEAVDELAFPSSGAFPAYPREGELPRNFYLQAGILRDDNILRREAGSGESETVFRFGAGANVTQRLWGRQTVYLEARGDQYFFNNFRELDHFAYGILGELRWEAGNSLSGTLGYGRRNFLVDLSERLTIARDEVTENNFYGTAAFRVTPRWRVRGSAETLDVDRPEVASAGTDVTSVTGGVDYVTPRGSAIGVEARTTRGVARIEELVGALPVDNDYEEREVAGLITYFPAPSLRLRARLGQTEREYEELPQRNFDGATGRIDADWRPGNKTILGFTAYRAPRSVVDIGASHVLVDHVSFGPRWAPTIKLVFGARFLREDREYQGEPAAALGLVPVRQEVVRALRFTAGWEPYRHHQVSAAYENGDRVSNRLGFDYDYDTVMVNYRYVF
jgi:hypothetical protein